MGDEPTDANLLEATVRGDDAAFALLVRRYIRTATLLAAQLLGDADDAEDVVQDAFTIVHRQAGEFDGRRPFAPWFYSIVRRLGKNRRSRQLHRLRLLGVWNRIRDERVAPPVDLAVFERMEAAGVARALEQLSPMQRACFELVVMRDLDIEEVAAMHDISASTVRQHVFRARSALRDILESRGEGDDR